MKKFISTAFLTLIIAYVFALGDTTSTSYKTGYSVGLFIGKYLPVALIILTAYVAYRYFSKKKSNS